MLAVEPRFFDRTERTTDSELLFFLTLTFGLDEDPLPALERMDRIVEASGHPHGVVEPLQMTVGVSNGEPLEWRAPRERAGGSELPVRSPRLARRPDGRRPSGTRRRGDQRVVAGERDAGEGERVDAVLDRRSVVLEPKS